MYSPSTGSCADTEELYEDGIYRKFADILEQHGPMTPTDNRILQQFIQLTTQERKVVMRAGSIKKFLQASDIFEFNEAENILSLAVYEDEQENNIECAMSADAPAFEPTANVSGGGFGVDAFQSEPLYVTNEQTDESADTWQSRQSQDTVYAHASEGAAVTNKEVVATDTVSKETVAQDAVVKEEVANDAVAKMMEKADQHGIKLEPPKPKLSKKERLEQEALLEEEKRRKASEDFQQRLLQRGISACTEGDHKGEEAALSANEEDISQPPNPSHSPSVSTSTKDYMTINTPGSERLILRKDSITRSDTSSASPQIFETSPVMTLSSNVPSLPTSSYGVSSSVYAQPAGMVATQPYNTGYAQAMYGGAVLVKTNTPQVPVAVQRAQVPVAVQPQVPSAVQQPNVQYYQGHPVVHQSMQPTAVPQAMVQPAGIAPHVPQAAAMTHAQMQAPASHVLQPHGLMQPAHAYTYPQAPVAKQSVYNPAAQGQGLQYAAPAQYVVPKVVPYGGGTVYTSPPTAAAYYTGITVQGSSQATQGGATPSPFSIGSSSPASQGQIMSQGQNVSQGQIAYGSPNLPPESPSQNMPYGTNSYQAADPCPSSSQSVSQSLFWSQAGSISQFARSSQFTESVSTTASHYSALSYVESKPKNQTADLYADAALSSVAQDQPLNLVTTQPESTGDSDARNTKLIEKCQELKQVGSGDCSGSRIIQLYTSDSDDYEMNKFGKTSDLSNKGDVGNKTEPLTMDSFPSHHEAWASGWGQSVADEILEHVSPSKSDSDAEKPLDILPKTTTEILVTSLIHDIISNAVNATADASSLGAIKSHDQNCEPTKHKKSSKTSIAERLEKTVMKYSGSSASSKMGDQPKSSDYTSTLSHAKPSSKDDVIQISTQKTPVRPENITVAGSVVVGFVSPSGESRSIQPMTVLNSVLSPPDIKRDTKELVGGELVGLGLHWNELAASPLDIGDIKTEVHDKSTNTRRPKFKDIPVQCEDASKHCYDIATNTEETSFQHATESVRNAIKRVLNTRHVATMTSLPAEMVDAHAQTGNTWKFFMKDRGCQTFNISGFGSDGNITLDDFMAAQKAETEGGTKKGEKGKQDYADDQQKLNIMFLSAKLQLKLIYGALCEDVMGKLLDTDSVEKILSLKTEMKQLKDTYQQERTKLMSWYGRSIAQLTLGTGLDEIKMSPCGLTLPKPSIDPEYQVAHLTNFLNDIVQYSDTDINKIVKVCTRQNTSQQTDPMVSDILSTSNTPSRGAEGDSKSISDVSEKIENKVEQPPEPSPQPTVSNQSRMADPALQHLLQQMMDNLLKINPGLAANPALLQNMAMQQMSMLMMTNPGMLSMTGAAPSNQVPVPRNPFQMSSNQMQTPNNPMQAPSNRMPAPSNQVPVPNSQNQTHSNRMPAPINQIRAHSNQRQAPGNQLSTPSNQMQAPSTQTPVLNNQVPVLSDHTPFLSNQVPTPTSSHSEALSTPPPGMPAMEANEKKGDQEVVQNSRRRLSGRRRSDNSASSSSLPSSTQRPSRASKISKHSSLSNTHDAESTKSTTSSLDDIDDITDSVMTSSKKKSKHGIDLMTASVAAADFKPVPHISPEFKFGQPIEPACTSTETKQSPLLKFGASYQPPAVPEAPDTGLFEFKANQSAAPALNDLDTTSGTLGRGRGRGKREKPTTLRKPVPSPQKYVPPAIRERASKQVSSLENKTNENDQNLANIAKDLMATEKGSLAGSETQQGQRRDVIPRGKRQGRGSAGSLEGQSREVPESWEDEVNPYAEPFILGDNLTHTKPRPFNANLVTSEEFPTLSDAKNANSRSSTPDTPSQASGFVFKPDRDMKATVDYKQKCANANKPGLPNAPIPMSKPQRTSHIPPANKIASSRKTPSPSPVVNVNTHPLTSAPVTSKQLSSGTTMRLAPEKPFPQPAAPQKPILQASTLQAINPQPSAQKKPVNQPSAPEKLSELPQRSATSKLPKPEDISVSFGDFPALGDGKPNNTETRPQTPQSDDGNPDAPFIEVKAKKGHRSKGQSQGQTSDLVTPESPWKKSAGAKVVGKQSKEKEEDGADTKLVSLGKVKVGAAMQMQEVGDKKENKKGARGMNDLCTISPDKEQAEVEWTTVAKKGKARDRSGNRQRRDSSGGRRESSPLPRQQPDHRHRGGAESSSASRSNRSRSGSRGRQVQAPSPPVAQRTSNYEKLLRKAESAYPHLNRDQVRALIGRARSSLGSLGGKTMADIMARIDIEYRLEFTSGRVVPPPGITRPGGRVGVDTFTPSWVQQQAMRPELHERPYDVIDSDEDPDAETCAICLHSIRCGHEKKLDCAHVFHEQCIKDWYKTERTCPCCRSHTLLSEDFPKLGA